MALCGRAVRFEAKPGKEEGAEAFLRQALQLASQEATTPLWFALHPSLTTFAMFDAFRSETAHEAYLDGPVAAELMACASELLSAMPCIVKTGTFGPKLPHELCDLH